MNTNKSLLLAIRLLSCACLAAAATASHSHSRSHSVNDFLNKMTKDINVSSDDYDWTGYADIANTFIANRTTPGVTIQVNYLNRTVYQAGFGNQTYPGDAFNTPVDYLTMYDIASLSKVFGVTAAAMRLYDLGLYSLDDTVSTYIPEFNNTGKENVTIRNLLLHNSGLQADLDLQTLQSRTPEYIIDSINHIALSYPTGKAYVYSDLNMVVLQQIVQRITSIPLNVFLTNNVYLPLEMNSTTYNPTPLLTHIIPPTEYDNTYRHQLIHGVVHDETAFFLGGVSGNAGLFSNVADLTKFMNMMLNRGEYVNSKGKKVTIFKGETVDLFTTRAVGLPYPNSRALGWDTVPIQSTLPCGTKFSQNSFGHTGFTGTTAWADKEKDLAIVMLANRVYPDRTHSSTAMTYFRQAAYTEICTILGY